MFAALQTFFGETLPYWWSPANLVAVTPSATWHFRWVYVDLVVACFVGAVITQFLKIRVSVKNRLQSMLWTNFFLGLALYFFRDQRLPFLGMDLWRFIQEIALIFWVNSIILFSRTGLIQEKLAEKVHERRQKYLPKAR